MRRRLPPCDRLVDEMIVLRGPRQENRASLAEAKNAPRRGLCRGTPSGSSPITVSAASPARFSACAGYRTVAAYDHIAPTSTPPDRPPPACEFIDFPNAFRSRRAAGRTPTPDDDRNGRPWWSPERFLSRGDRLLPVANGRS